MKKLPFIKPFHGGFTVVVLALCLSHPTSSEAAQPKVSKTKEAPKAGYIFFPAAPDEPRLQFLCSFTTEADMAGGSTKFAQFLIGKEPPKRGLFKPYGLAFFGDKLCVTDTGRHGLTVLDFEKRKLYYSDAGLEKSLHTPINIRVAPDGTRYVADRGHNQVLIFGTNDLFLGAIGEKQGPNAAWQTNATPGTTAAPGATKPMWPTDVAITKDRLYVTDLNNNCVRVYDRASRQLLFQIPRDRQDEPAKLFAPTNLALDSQGQLYVSDIGGFFVKKFDPEGKYLRTYGRSGDRPGEFARPKGVAVDREGRLYVVDAASQAIQIFDAEGRLLLHFGEPGGSAAPLDLPAQVIIDYDHLSYFQKLAASNFKLEYLVIASNQYGDRKVSVYGFGHRQ
jgi:DNA-binding beta-propeller fold protein YncE